MIANSIKIQYPEDASKMEVVLTTSRSIQTIQEIAKLKEIVEGGNQLNVEIKQYKKKRSLDANSYCWIISQKIAEAIGNTKEYVYKQAIKQVGQFEIVPIKIEASNRWMAVWESKGLGWYSEILGHSKIEGYVNTINYYGSSVYNTKEFSLLLNEIVYQAKELGIDVITENEKKSLLEMWGKGV